jgi:hypothetical protein
MKVQIKSVTPSINVSEDGYDFDVAVVSDSGATRTVTVPANELLNFRKAQAIIAHRTGCLLLGNESEWLILLEQVWRAPPVLPDRSNDLKEIEELGADIV